MSDYVPYEFFSFLILQFGYKVITLPLMKALSVQPYDKSAKLSSSD